MRAGDLRERVVIYRQMVSTGTLGEPSPTWTPVATVWAAVIPLKSWEIYRRGGTVPTSAVRMLFRGNVDVLESDRVLWGGRYYEVYSLGRSPKRDSLEVLAIWIA